MWLAGTGCGGGDAGAGGGPAGDESTGAVSQAVINGVPAFHPALRAIVGVGGCTGTLIAPRTILTAAHCLPALAAGCPAGAPQVLLTGANGVFLSTAVEVSSWAVQPGASPDLFLTAGRRSPEALASLRGRVPSRLAPRSRRARRARGNPPD
ncbi:MAG: trypsin-like serine protease [Polyangiaceae bacterium]|nr:trypsin-like serine protease [Polyangiaceae bacterium]